MKLWIIVLVIAATTGVALGATARGPICQTSARVGSTTYYSCSSGYTPRST